jgi:hypothetical protein
MRPFTDDQGRAIPGYMTTSELIAELETEPVGTDRYASLAVEAIQRSGNRAFPANRVPELPVLGTKDFLVGGIEEVEIYPNTGE